MGCCDRIFHRPAFFTALLAITMFTTFGANGAYSSGVLTTLQRDFKLKSSEIGVLLTVNDIVGLVLVTPLAYLGAKRHRPRTLGVLTLIFALGCLCIAIPQFLGGSGSDDQPSPGTGATAAAPAVNEIYSYNSSAISQPGASGALSEAGTTTAQLCVSDFNGVNDDDGLDSTKCSATDEAAAGAQYSRAVWLYIGQALCGIGGAGYFPLGITYIDDGVPKTSSSIHVAVVFGTASLAPLFAFSLSGVVLSYHKDFYKIDVDDLGYGDNDPRWIGAWWLGYLIYSAIYVIISIAYFFFPKEWPHKKETKEEELKMNTEVQNGAGPADLIKEMMPKPGSSVLGVIKGYIWAMSRLVTNVTYMACLLALCAELSIASGFFSFVGRYIQTQYDVSPSKTSLILGCVTSPTVFIGNMVGGIIVKKTKLGMRGLAIMSMIISLLILVISPLNFAVGCEKGAISGVTVPYPGEDQTQLAAECMNDCGCTPGTYAPVCGADGLTYITPCHAGCTQEMLVEGATPDDTMHVFTGCSCTGSNTTSYKYDNDYAPDVAFTAVQEACPRDCFSKLIAFIVIFGVSGFISATMNNPSFMLKLRCVDEGDRALSLGFSSLFLRVLGFVPAPIYFGAAIQTTCLMFQETCGKTGNCLIFDSDKLRNVVFGLILILKGASLLFYFLAFISMRRDKDGVYHQMEVCRSSSSKKEKADDV